MRIFGFIWRRLRKLWQPSETLQTGIDSHKWESKIETLKSIPRDRY